MRPASFFQKVHWLNEERRTEKRRKDLEAKQKQTLSSLLKMKILQRGSDRESVLRARRKSLLLGLTSSAQPGKAARSRKRISQGIATAHKKIKNFTSIRAIIAAPAPYGKTKRQYKVNTETVEMISRLHTTWLEKNTSNESMYSGKISFNRIVSHKRRYYNY